VNILKEFTIYCVFYLIIYPQCTNIVFGFKDSKTRRFGPTHWYIIAIKPKKETN